MFICVPGNGQNETTCTHYWTINQYFIFTIYLGIQVRSAKRGFVLEKLGEDRESWKKNPVFSKECALWRYLKAEETALNLKQWKNRVNSQENKRKLARESSGDSPKWSKRLGSGVRSWNAERRDRASLYGANASQ